MYFIMKNYLCIIIVSVFVQEIVASPTTKAEHNDAKERLSLVQLFRIKRFDFNMFGCGCRPVVQCKRDSDCHESHGDDYKCSVNCCTFLCIHNSDSKSPPGNRDFGQYQSHNRGSEHPNGQNGHGHQELNGQAADTADDYTMAGDTINNVEVNINNPHGATTIIPTSDNTDKDMGAVTQDVTKTTVIVKSPEDDVDKPVDGTSPTEVDHIREDGKP